MKRLTDLRTVMGRKPTEWSEASFDVAEDVVLVETL
jgi:hypothetical protein